MTDILYYIIVQKIFPVAYTHKSRNVGVASISNYRPCRDERKPSDDPQQIYIYSERKEKLKKIFKNKRSNESNIFMGYIPPDAKKLTTFKNFSEGCI